MPSVTRLAQDVVAKVWPAVTARSRRGWQWLRRNPLWSASGVVAAVLIILLITHWNAYKKQREAFTPLFTLVAGLAIAGVTLMRHFAQTDADRQRRITESFSKAIEQLGSEKLEVRLGGIYALERISQESPQDHRTVMENLTAFLRERTRRTEAEQPLKPLDRRISEHAYLLWENAGRPDGRSEEFWEKATNGFEIYGVPPATDIEAVLTVIMRRSKERRELEIRENRAFDLRQAVLRRVDLQEAHLIGAILTGTNLEGAWLEGAHLEGAHLREAHLEGANLQKARLEGSFLGEAHLEGAYLGEAHLEGAHLDEAHLEDAQLGEAHLEGADLWRAHLEGACLVAANLKDADLRQAHLEDVDLRGAHLEGADLRNAEGLTQAQIDEAWGDADIKLPNGLIPPPDWAQPERGKKPPA